MSSCARIALFAATVWEVSAVRAALPDAATRTVGGRRVVVGSAGEREYWLVRTGVGHEQAAQASGWLFHQQRFHLAVSTGFACALVPAEIGGLLVGHEVLSMPANGDAGPEPLGVPGPERDSFLAFACGRIAGARIGPFLSVDRIVGRAADKREYARVTGAMGLDMESAALARESQRAQVPFVIARTVSDLLDEDLPLDFNLFLTAAGWLAGAGTVLAAPWRLRGLGRLRRQSRLAADRLTEFFRGYITAMAVHHRPHRTTELA
jgi:adenosylhomocysteine nucleosidase